MKKARKWLSLLLAVVLVVGLLPSTALAIQTYPVWVGGVQVDASNAKDVLGDGTVVFTPATGSEPARLTLNNADIVGTSLPAYPDDNDGIYSEIDLTLEIHGWNKITAEDAVSDAVSNGIYMEQVNLVIEGDGTLDVTAAKGKYSHAVYAMELTMRGGTVRATAGEASSYSWGVDCYAFVMEGGTLEATSGKGGKSYAVDVENMTVLGGTIRANGGESSDESAAIRCGTFVMESGTLEATSGKSSSSRTIFASEMTVRGGTIRATAGEGLEFSNPVLSGKFVMEGGTLEATAGKGKFTYGVQTDSMTVLDGTIRATAGNAYSFCKAVYSNHFTMEGGTLIAEGGEAPQSLGADVGGTITGGTLTAIGQTTAFWSAPDPSGYANSAVTVNTEPTEIGASAWNGKDELGGYGDFKYVKVAPYNPFIDVAEGQYFYEPVLWAVNCDPQITKGTDATHFSPNATCTRGQVVTFLWRAKGCPEPTMTLNPFSDVKEGAFYYKAVLWAVQNGITNGVDPTHFGPNRGCTRGQVVTFLHRAQGTPTPGSDANPFSDVKAGAFYYNAVLWAVEKNVTKGTSATTFSPNATCTRGQIVTFLYRAQK